MSGDHETAAAKVAAYDWEKIGAELDTFGTAILPKLLSDSECHNFATKWHDSAVFRTTISMARHGFGRGEYKYYAYPLPALIAGLRENLYPQLAPIASDH